MANHPSVVGEGDLEWSEHSHGETFGSRRKQLGSSAGGEKLGCSAQGLALPLPPRQRRGNLRAGGLGHPTYRWEEIGVSKGDYVALPARAQEAHQIVNDSGAVLRYLCFSTMVEPDVIVYPDSGKVGIFAGCAWRTEGEENLQQVPPRGGRGRLL
jgi:hypothetical protein